MKNIAKMQRQPYHLLPGNIHSGRHLDKGRAGSDWSECKKGSTAAVRRETGETV
nr:MAG TPA: hypothetical protein [Caudoviricetes sp.]